MKDKFIRSVSPLNLTVIGLFDIISVVLIVWAVRGVIRQTDFYHFAFVGIMVFDLITAALATKNLMSNGVRFTESEIIFTAHDENNRYRYSEIDSVQVGKDTAASLKKNFVDRYSGVLLFLKDGTVATVELGLTSKKKLQSIEEEIKKRIG